MPVLAQIFDSTSLVFGKFPALD